MDFTRIWFICNILLGAAIVLVNVGLIKKADNYQRFTKLFVALVGFLWTLEYIFVFIYPSIFMENPTYIAYLRPVNTLTLSVILADAILQLRKV